MFQKFLDLFYPKKILEGSSCWITAEEWKDIQVHIYREERATLEERGLGFIDAIVSACHYHDSIILQRAIFTLKYRRVPGLSSRLADFIILVGTQEVTPGMLVAPVPLHWQRRFDRGFNQSALLAKRTAHVLDVPYAHLLRRVRDTGHQAWRSREERLSSMHNAFAMCKNITLPEHVILIDDIATTGATVDACAQTLKNAGVKKVEAWVVARG